MPIPLPPTNLSPADNTTFPQGTTQVTLSWSAVAGATSYAVRANDRTDPNARYSGNNCPASAPHYLCVDNLTNPSFTVPVIAGHNYEWWVHAVNASGVSNPTFAHFTISAANSAQFISQAVPELLAPNATAQVTVTMKNIGTTAWTQDAGYKLGSQNPENNLIWGGNGRVLVTSTVPPGASFTFRWTIRAPATPGQYNFQWRMLREHVEWFGDFTPNVRINVSGSVVNRLTRDRSTGKIKYDNQPRIFGGCNYDLFNPDGSFPRSLNLSQNGGVYLKVYEKDATGKAIEPCPPNPAPSLYLKNWNQSQPWTGLFNVVTGSNNNLLRLFLTGGTSVPSGSGELEPLYLFPFRKVLRSGKWKFQVYSAVVDNLWDDNYFNRLKAFAEEAERRNVFLQLSLFNYFDLTSRLDATRFRAWCRSPYNPALSDNPANDSNWGNNHLVFSPAISAFACGDAASDSQEAARQAFFIKPTNRLRVVQEAFVRRTVQALYGRSNIIFEIMNEARQSPLEDRARFYSTVVGWIINHGQGWRPLISVNASPLSPGGDDFDIDWWQRNKASVPNYDEVDMISYHGLTAYSVSERFCGSTNLRSIPAVDDTSIGTRISEHQRRHTNSKAIMLSTDAVRTNSVTHPLQNSGGGTEDMALRDGQIQTTYDRASNDKPSVKSDLADWAYWVYKRAVLNRGVIHLHNHSTFEQSFYQLDQGWQDAT